MTAVDVRDVSVSLGGLRVLDDVSLAVERGRLVGLVGPNGAGKTTLLRTITGLVEPDAGSVHLCGSPVSRCSAREVSRLAATVPQDTGLDFDFSVREVVEMGRHPHRPRLGGRDPDRDLIEEGLARAEVAHLADRRITDVSGGERARVLLARALAQDTPVLLLDEPVASLDVAHRHRTLDLVRSLAEEDGRAVIAAIHDLDVAARYADELVLVDDGRIRACGAPGDVLTRTAVESTFGAPVAVGRNPLTGTPHVTVLDRELDPEGEFERDGRPDARVHVVCGGGSGSRILHRLVAAGYAVSAGALHAGDPDLATARALDVEVVATAPFSPIGSDAREAVRRSIRAADVTVLADFDVGPGNRANLAAAEASDRLVVVEGRPFAERNHAGSEARERFEAISSRARVVPERDLLAAVDAALEDGEPTVAPPSRSRGG